jgi:hypothetical protein
VEDEEYNHTRSKSYNMKGPKIRANFTIDGPTRNVSQKYEDGDDPEKENVSQQILTME